MSSLVSAYAVNTLASSAVTLDAVGTHKWQCHPSTIAHACARKAQHVTFTLSSSSLLSSNLAGRPNLPD